DQSIETRLQYGQDFHQQLLARLNARLDLSQRHISQRYDDWDQTDEHCRLFIDLARRAKKSDKTSDPSKAEMPFQRAIVVPMSLAILMVRLTQLIAIFSSREPMIQLEGRGPEDVRPAKIMEALLAYDQQTVGLTTLYALCQDSEKYGLGVVHDCWEVEQGWMLQQPPQRSPAVAGFMRLLGLDALLRPQQAWGTIREFNRWEPVDPFHFWPDPRVPVSQIQQSEFIGHRTFRGAMHLKERSQANGGCYFNLDFLKQFGQASASSRVTLGKQGTARNRFAASDFQLRDTADDEDKGFYAVDNLEVKLIPKDWQLGPSDRPEIWQFALADQALIIRAHRSAYGHGQFCYALGESIPDEHALFNPRMIRNLAGLQRVINWLVNSHVDNVRKFLNDALVYAPSLIEESDLLNPGPARHIRLTAKAEKLLVEGQLPIQSLLFQVPYADVTRQHLQTVNALFDMAQRLAATSDPQMSQTTDDQRTLGEVQQVIAGSTQRLAITARLLDAQALQP